MDPSEEPQVLERSPAWILRRVQFCLPLLEEGPALPASSVGWGAVEGKDAGMSQWPNTCV